jgi:hypothetical protein
MIIEETEFRGKPILVIKDEENKRILFSAGLNKCKLILEQLEAIKSFIDKYNIK